MVWICKYGAGGSSISGRLDLKGAIRVNSPVFNLIAEHFQHYQDEDMGRLRKRDFDGFCTGLFKLFQDGKASPTELDSGGKGIVFVSVQQILPRMW